MLQWRPNQERSKILHKWTTWSFLLAERSVHGKESKKSNQHLIYIDWIPVFNDLLNSINYKFSPVLWMLTSSFYKSRRLFVMYAVEIDSWARYWWYYFYFEWSYKRNIVYSQGQQVDKILILKPKNNIHAFKPTYTQNRGKTSSISVLVKISNRYASQVSQFCINSTSGVINSSIMLTCQGQFPGLASTPPITRELGDFPQDAWGGGPMCELLSLFQINCNRCFIYFFIIRKIHGHDRVYCVQQFQR